MPRSGHTISHVYWGCGNDSACAFPPPVIPSDALSDQYYDSSANARLKAKAIRDLLRPNPPDMSLEALMKFVIAAPQGPTTAGDGSLGTASGVTAQICHSSIR
jgi:hypothetical protein